MAPKKPRGAGEWTFVTLTLLTLIALLLTPLSQAATVDPAVVALSEATPDATEYLSTSPLTVQAPPISAVPNPFATVRLKASEASSAGWAGGRGETGRLAVPDAPESVATVRFTW